MAIRALFDPNKDIQRTIEKVISYGASEESRLKAEISEYVVTDSIEEQFRKLLERMQLAMETGGENEIGVWVSGFYGSGKSSFTKYLGMAFDDKRTIDGTPFINHLQDRLNKAQTKALLTTVARRFPAAVVMLDLASEMLAGATMEDVSTVLYFKVLPWAGYSRNLKVAAFERMVEKDGRMQELEECVGLALKGADWSRVQNNPLAIDGLIPKIAHEMYPALFPEPKSFSSSTEGFYEFEDQRVQAMIDIVREKSGKENIIFVVDEVGQGRQEARQRLAAPRGRDQQQRGFCRAGQHILLMRVQGPAARSEPVGDRGRQAVHGAEDRAPRRNLAGVLPRKAHALIPGQPKATPDPCC